MVTYSQSWVHNFFKRWFISKVIHLQEKSILKVQANGYADTDMNLLHTNGKHESH